LPRPRPWGRSPLAPDHVSASFSCSPAESKNDAVNHTAILSHTAAGQMGSNKSATCNNSMHARPALLTTHWISCHRLKSLNGTANMFAGQAKLKSMVENQSHVSSAAWQHTGTSCIVANKASSVSVCVASLEGMTADQMMKPEETALSSGTSMSAHRPAASLAERARAAAGSFSNSSSLRCLTLLNPPKHLFQCRNVIPTLEF